MFPPLPLVNNINLLRPSAGFLRPLKNQPKNASCVQYYDKISKILPYIKVSKEYTARYLVEFQSGYY